MPLSSLLIAVVLAGGGGSPDPLPWDGVTLRRYEDPVARVAFPIPLTQTVLESRHFPEAAPEQMTDVFTLVGPQVEEVELGLYRNPKQLGLDAWVTATLPFLRAPEHTVLPYFALKSRVPAVLFEQPRSSQQYARRTAVFRLGERVVVLSCRNIESPRAVAAFEAILGSLEALP